MPDSESVYTLSLTCHGRESVCLSVYAMLWERECAKLVHTERSWYTVREVHSERRNACHVPESYSFFREGYFFSRVRVKESSQAELVCRVCEECLNHYVRNLSIQVSSVSIQVCQECLYLSVYLYA